VGRHGASGAYETAVLISSVLIPLSLDSKRLDALSVADEALLVENARSLIGVPEALVGSMLLGKHVCLYSDSQDVEQVQLFESAARGLGARVAHVRPHLSRRTGPYMARETARMLGRLYDIIGCDGLDRAMALFIRAEAGIPVHVVLDAARCAATLASRLDGSDGHAKRMAILRAILVSTIYEVRP
jgi:ornithine carbamoyltransferase